VAKLKANVRPAKQRSDTRWFKGTCSKCHAKKTQVTKVKHCQICDECLGNASLLEPVERALNGQDSAIKTILGMA
jgi:hypothetical protein